MKNRYKIILTTLIFSVIFLSCAHVSLADEIDAAAAAGGRIENGTFVEGLVKQENYSPSVLLNFVLVISSGLITFFGWFIDFAIALGSTVMNLPIVQSGSQAMINFANLGFVFAIIVIAFATIFRVQGYAMKQILWKLIVAALLVNFSLTIAGAFISVANIFTDFFRESLSGQNVSDGLMGILEPQALVKVEDASAWDVIGGFFSGLFKYMASLLFVIVFNFIIILTFLALAIMLLIRTVMLGILLVLMPIVWLLWIFPGTQRYWSEWWTTFIRWTFFAPIVLFFIVLVINGGEQLNAVREQAFSEGNTAAQAAFKDSMTLNPDFFDHVAQIIIATGLLMGGLIAANKMGITFASTAMGLAKGSGKMFGNWVGRRSAQLGTSLFRNKPVTDALEKMESAGTKGGWVSRLAGLPVRKIGSGLSRVSALGAEKAVEGAKKRIAGLDDKRLARMINTLDAPARVAALQQLKSHKALDLLPDASAFINEDTKNLFIRYGQPAPDYTGMERAVGFNSRMLRLAKGEEIKIDSEGKEVKEGGESLTLEEATRDFYKGFRASHFNNMQVDEFFGKKDELGLSGDVKRKLNEEAAKAILGGVPDGLGNVYRNIKSVNMDEFHDNNLFKYVKEEAGKTGVSESQWLKKNHPKAYNFYTSFAARSLGIGIDPVKQKNGKNEEMTGQGMGI